MYNDFTPFIGDTELEQYAHKQRECTRDSHMCPMQLQCSHSNMYIRTFKHMGICECYTCTHAHSNLATHIALKRTHTHVTHIAHTCANTIAPLTHVSNASR